MIDTSAAYEEKKNKDSISSLLRFTLFKEQRKRNSIWCKWNTINTRRRSNISLHITANTTRILEKRHVIFACKLCGQPKGHTHTRRSRSDFKGFRGIYFTGETFQWFVVFFPSDVSSVFPQDDTFPVTAVSEECGGERLLLGVLGLTWICLFCCRLYFLCKGVSYLRILWLSILYDKFLIRKVFRLSYDVMQLDFEYR